MVSVANVVVFQRTGKPGYWQEGRDLWWHELTQGVSADCPPEEVNAEDPLFILYTSGLDRQTERRAAHHRRLPGVRCDDL